MKAYCKRKLRRFLRRKMHFQLTEKLLAYLGIHMKLTFTYYALLVSLVFGFCLFALSDLLISKPLFMDRVCPGTYGRDSRLDRLAEDHQPLFMFDCSDFWQHDRNKIAQAKEFKWCKRSDRITDGNYMQLTRHCDSFKKLRGYGQYHVTQEEKDFPLAFSIIMYENAEQAERLLRAIYRPQNFYCIHVDAASPASVHDTMATIARCFDNVFVSSRSVDVTWAMFTVLESEIVCLRDLYNYTGWKYFINLTGREFPLKTNLELVKILKAYNGANDVDGTPHRRPPEWTDYKWVRPNWHTGIKKTPPPHGYLVHKGSTHVALTHKFVDFVLHNKTAQDLLEWFKDTRTPDEMYFNTLSHNSQLGVPGAYIGDPELKRFHTRLKIWQSETETCEGKWFRFICQFGVGDLHRIHGAKELFVNKLRIEFEPLAFECLEQWYHNRTLGGIPPDFNVSFYENLPISHHHNNR